jgi:hypothetical protein
VNPRVSWGELPAGVRRRIEAEVGPFAWAEQVDAGHNCLAALIVHTTAGSWFIKGIHADHARAVWNQSNEAAINPYVEAVTAPLEFRVQADGWDILGFRYLVGHRHANLAPGSPDLPLIAATLQALAVLPAPDDVPLRTIEDRWHGYIGNHAALLTGPAIAHTDLHRHNILIGAAGAKLVDWAWPTLAAPWVDTACAGLQLIAAGHHPAAAQQWCQQLPAYRAADGAATDAFVAAAQAMWDEIAVSDPQPWKLGVASAARRWATHRGLPPVRHQ